MSSTLSTSSPVCRTVAAAVVSNARHTMSDAGGGRSNGEVLRLPYLTEGGSVPLYSMMHGQVDKRHWAFRNASWCELCREPISRWLDHQSRKDHALMDLHYSQLVEWPRRWNPETLLSTVVEHLGLDGAEPYHAVFGRGEKEGRTCLHAMLIKLEEAGMVYFGRSRDTYLQRMQGGLRGMDHQGALVLHECLLSPFLRLYPNGLIQDFSNLLDFISCGYNMETVYDMCGMYTLDKIALETQIGPTSPAAMGLGGIATSSTAARGYENDLFATLTPTASSTSTSGSAADGADAEGSGAGDGAGASRLAQLQAARAAKLQEKSEEEAFSRKSVFVRQLLGQLRWLLLPEQVHPAGFTFPPHIITLGEIALKSLVVAIVETRLCEYMVRTESVWINFGLERRQLQPSATATMDDVLPRPLQCSYRPMARDMKDLYSVNPSALDAMVQSALAQKMLPPLAAFGEESTTTTTTGASKEGVTAATAPHASKAATRGPLQ